MNYTYDAAGRMATMSINGVLQGSYKYDFAGRQAIRTIAATGVTIHSVFDAQGRRIAEYNQATGALIREYVWLGWGKARPDGLARASTSAPNARERFRRPGADCRGAGPGDLARPHRPYRPASVSNFPCFQLSVN